MPNHITTQVEIKGTKEQIAKLVKDTGLIREGDPLEDNKFDFNGIIKMPDEVRNTVSPTGVVATEEEAEKINSDYAEHMKDKKYKGEPIRAISKAESERRIKEYGAINWYDWAYRNWGTKWNAYEVHYTDGDDTKIVIQFDTAWDTPRAIWEKLEEMGFTVNGVIYGEMEGTEEIGEGYEIFEVSTTIDVEYVG